MREHTDELRGYLLEETTRKDQLELMKYMPLFGTILIGAVCLICLSVEEGIVFGIKAMLVAMVSTYLFFKGLKLWIDRLGLDLDASFCINSDGISTTVRRKKYEQKFAWSEIAEAAEIIAGYTMGKSECRYIPYIALAKKPLRELNLLIAADAEHAMESYGYLFCHPDLIAIPKTEEAVQYIERFRKITPLPEKYRLS